MSQSPNHKADHSHIDESFTRLWQPLEVFGKTTLAVQPTERALYHPPSGQQHKSFLAFFLLYYRQLPAQFLPYPLYQFSSIAPICPYQLQTTETPPMFVFSLLDTLKQRFEHGLCSISILYRGRSHYYQHYQSERVHNQMSLATPYVFVL